MQEWSRSVRLRGERLSEFLEMIPHGQEPAYGFASRGEFPEATLGEPYRVFTMAPGDFQVGSEGVLRKLDEWRVPVSVRGDVRVPMTVVRTVAPQTAI